MLYQDPELIKQVGDNPQDADIPDVHKAAFRFTETFVRCPWEFTAQSLDELRSLGLTDANIVQWALVAAMQTWWVMSADGGGIPLDGDAEVGMVLANDRTFYHNRSERPVELMAQPASPKGTNANGIAWVETDIDNSAFSEIRSWANDKYGYLPNLLAATSLRPDVSARQRLALELLDRPQTASLTPSLHAMIRARVSILHQCAYTQAMTREFLAQHARAGAWDILARPDLPDDLDAKEKVALAFVDKLIRNSFKITAKDARLFRDVGLDDAAYIDVLNTSSIQASLDRLALALGVAMD